MPVLISNGLTRLTPPLVWALRRAGGVWAVADSDGGVRDGLTCQLLEPALTQEVRARSGLLAGTDGGVAGPSQWLGTGEYDRSEPKGKDPWTAWQLKVSVLVDHCAPGESSFAVSAATLLYEVQRYEEAVDRWASPTPTSWGLTEPALIPWSSAAVTEQSTRGNDREANRTTDRARRVFEQLAAGQNITSGLVVGRFGPWDISVRPQGEQKPEPLAFFLGAAMSRKFQDVVGDLVELFDGTRTANGGFYLPLATEQESGWDRLGVLEQYVGKDLLAEFLSEQDLDWQW